MTNRSEPSNVQAQKVGATKASALLHTPRLVTNRQVAEVLHGTHALGRFNNALALGITKVVGTMWAAYLFVLVALISLPQALTAFQNGDTVTGISWLSQSFLQLVLLPIILVGQNVISAAQDARAETDHETLTALHTMSVRQLQLLEQQDQILTLLNARSRGQSN